ncbi:MAG: GTP cyclohydrolase II [Candidatus Micrarchaeota archaeon]|nr:GTP cyclohydrolase II [Candidatus Micrarchaeota archaeon]
MAIKFVAKALFPTVFGNFELYCFEDEKNNPHFALVKGKIENEKGVVCRIHSKCLTGDALGSLRCDCREQYQKAMRYISKQKKGVLLYLEQEGRGIGLVNKIRAYSLQDQGYDTVEANLKLGFRADEREYSIAAEILKYLKVKSVALITNNPQKIEQLKKLGIKITKRIELKIKGSKYSREYLKTKKEKMGHLIIDEQN